VSPLIAKGKAAASTAEKEAAASIHSKTKKKLSTENEERPQAREAQR